MSKAFVRATALASALAADLDSAAERLSGEAAMPRRKDGEDWPYLAIPVEGDGWRRRTEGIVRAVAEDLRRRARLDAAQWQELPCIVGSSSYSIGEVDPGGRPALDPPLDFCNALARRFGAGGPVMAVTTACTSGLGALDIGASLIEEGAFRDVLVLGAEFSNRFTVAGFAGLELLSRTGAKPCDRNRDGLVLGEALGAVLLSASPGAWRLEAIASGVDAASLTGAAPGGEVVENTMRCAMTKAQWQPADVGLIKLQAGGSPAADLAEARAVRRLFAPPPATVSLKGALGHTLGASGPAELALLLASLARGRIPPTWGFTEPDDELGLAPSAGDAIAAQRLLFNLSGFGGNVMTLALQRTE